MEILVKNIILKSKEDIEVAFLYKLGPIYEQLKERNVKVKTFNDSNNVIIIARNIIKYCRSQKIDIINVHDGGLKSLLIYYIILKTTKIKMIRTVHADEIENINRFIKNKIKKKLVYIFMKATMVLSEKVICVSKAVEIPLKNEFNLKNTVVIYNGIDKKNLVNKRVSKFNNRIIFCGRLFPQKGVDILIESLNILKQKKKLEFELVIVGDGVERKKLEHMTNEYQLSDNIKFKGFQDNVLNFLDDSSVFIYPIIWNEAFGISIVEAMGRGCIPITFEKGGIPEIISNGENGFLVKKISAELLAETILKVYDLSDNEKNNIINNAIATASKFTLDNTVDKLRDEYNKISN